MRLLSSFIGLGWWILKSSNDPSILSMIQHLSIETQSSQRHRKWLQPHVLLQYDDRQQISYNVHHNIHISQTIVEDQKQLVIANLDRRVYYVYNKLDFFDLYGASNIHSIGMVCVVLLQILLLYRQTEWLSLLWMNQNHL